MDSSGKHLKPVCFNPLLTTPTEAAAALGLIQRLWSQPCTHFCHLPKFHQKIHPAKRCW